MAPRADERLRPYQPIIVKLKNLSTGEYLEYPARVVRQLNPTTVYIEVNSVYMVIALDRIVIVPNWNGVD
jgi:hypothetical protein